jgi:hypothetical protein
MHKISNWRLSFQSAISLALLLPLISLSGCNRGPAMSHVSGTVLFKDGTPPTGGVCVINFQPTMDSKAELRKGASSAINPDGTFDLWTRMPGDGVYHGDYEVRFVIQKGAMDPTPLVAPKYTDARTSGFKVTVDDDIDDLKFEIERAPGAPRG